MRKKPANQPPLEQRLIYVAYLRRMKCRYNPSLRRFLDLPRIFQAGIAETWSQKHRNMALPEFEVSDRPKRKK